MGIFDGSGGDQREELPLPRTLLLLGTILLLGVALRLYMSVTIFYSTFDTSTPGLMALRILDGERPLFYYGQPYMGALESYLAALLFSLFGPSLTALTLSPILFAVGWQSATYLLFSEIFGRRPALAAALCLAVPGWDTIWYTLGSYGGYPGSLFFGTMALWLAVRLVRRQPGPLREGVYIALLGLLSGLALWTNYLSAAYLLTALVLLALHLVRRGFDRGLIARFAAGSPFFLLGVAPVLIVRLREGGSSVGSVNFSLQFVGKSIEVLRDRVMPRYISWPFSIPSFITVAVLLVLAAAALLCLLRLVRRRSGENRGWQLVPLLFCVLFLGLYLPHRMAAVGAPRYLIPLANMAFCTIFSVPLALSGERLRRLAGGLLAAWIVFNGAGAFLTCFDRAPKKKETVKNRNRIVADAEKTGASTVMMVGGFMFGHSGQTFGFYARDRVRFVSVYDERHQPTAQASETDPEYALAFQHSVIKKGKGSLGALDVEYDFIKNQKIGLAYNLAVPSRPRRSILPAEMTVFAEGGPSLTDRVHETFLEGTYEEGAAFTVDLGEERVVDSLWLAAPDWLQEGLPEAYRIEASVDGEHYETVRDVKASFPVAYLAGRRVYMKGYFGLQEIAVGGRAARYLRFFFLKGQGEEGTWRLSELFVFEKAARGGEYREEEVEDIVSTLVAKGVDFTVADRWLSARLVGAIPRSKAPPAYPRFNPKYRSTRISRRIEPRKGLAVAARNEVARECVDLIEQVYGEESIDQRLRMPSYTLLILGDGSREPNGGERLVWNGHTLLKTAEPPGSMY